MDEPVGAGGTDNTVAGIVGGSVTQIGKIERYYGARRGFRRPRKRLLVALAAVLGLAGSFAVYRLVQPEPPALRVDSVAVRGGKPGWSYLFPTRLDLSATELAELDRARTDPTAYTSWMTAHGGVPPDDVAVQVALRGQGGRTPVITDVRVLKECRGPATGTLLHNPPAGEGERAVQIGFDLDADLPVAQYYKNGGLVGDYFAENTVPVKPGDVVTLTVHGVTETRYCEFRLELAVNDGSSSYTQVVDHAGRPFAVSAMSGFARFGSIYAGGVANLRTGGSFTPADPATYEGYLP